MKVDIPGPAGLIEARLDDGNDGSQAFAVLCHPHPQYGGTMDDAVLSVLARVLAGAGVRCLRFNFRGVGASAGTHDGKGGEVEDLLAVESWLREEHSPGHLTLGGYSFGAAVVWQALTSLSPPDRMILVAPPVGLMPFARQPVSFGLDVFAGDADQFVDAAALEALSDARIHVIPGADHFFSGKWGDLAAGIEQALQADA
jgi:alpha/beta superfamily hydrolase